MRAWTDYPFPFLGDRPGATAPVREIQILSYDWDRYVTILVEGHETEIKAGYCYVEAGRCGEVPTVARRRLRRLPRTRSQSIAHLFRQHAPSRLQELQKLVALPLLQVRTNDLDGAQIQHDLWAITLDGLSALVNLTGRDEQDHVVASALRLIDPDFFAALQLRLLQ